MMEVWFTAAELAGLELPGLPTHKSKMLGMIDREGWFRPEWEHQLWRKRVGRGGGREFHMDVLPPAAKVGLAVRLAADDPANHQRDSARAQQWAAFDRL